MKRKTTTTAGQPRGHRRTGPPAPHAPPTPAIPQAGGVRPWHLLVIGVLMSAGAGAVVTRDGGTVQTVAVIVTVLTAGLVAAGVVRTLGPLVAADAGEDTEMLAGRTRAALEREKMLVLRSIKEVEFDRAMRKISDADYGEIVPRLRTRAVGLIRQLEGGGGYRALIERDLAAVMPAQPPVPAAAATVGTREAGDGRAAVSSVTGGTLDASDGSAFRTHASTIPTPDKSAAPAPAGTCPDCLTANDTDARFCKSCGTRLPGDV